MLYWEQLLQVEGAEITEALKPRPVKRAASKDPTVTELRRAGSNGSKMNIAILGDGTDDMALFNGLNWNGAYLGMFESRDGVLQLRRTYANTSGFSPLPGWELQRKDRFWVSNVDGKTAAT